VKLTKRPDQLGLVGAIFALVMGVIWFAWGETKINAVMDPLPEIVGQSLSESGAWNLASVSGGVPVSWVDPAIGADEQEWVFDVFTPPVIFYNRESGRFSVTRPELEDANAAEAAAKSFGVVLRGVRAELYRLQVVGYAGYDGEEFGIFQNEVTGVGMVARAGARFDDLGLEIRTLEVRREDLIVPHSMPLREMVGVAQVWDETTQRLVRLSSSGRRWTDSPLATVQNPETGEEREVKAGDQIEWSGSRFAVIAVQLDPTSVTIHKIHDNGVREIETLIPDSDNPTNLDTDTFSRTP
jgi:hypothetical protein